VALLIFFTRWGSTNVYKILVGKPDVNRPLGRSMSRWKDICKVGGRETGCEGMDRFRFRWLRTRCGVGFLWTQQESFWLH